MIPFVTLTAPAAPLLMANVDTDMIIPKQFLKTTRRDGLAVGLFHELKTRPDGSPNADFVLNQPAYASAAVLIAGPNFGCGSSREHAPWALFDQGLRCVIAASFADIFYNNCFNNGLLPIVLPPDVVAHLAGQASGGNAVFHIDLPAQTVSGPDGASHRFEIDPARKLKLLEGLDDIGMTLKGEGDIATHEMRRRLAQPWLP
jgi:3-isopropylmalate dehydratase small subunit